MDQQYDVVIFEAATRTVDTVVGRNMPLEAGDSNARRRHKTVADRLNADFGACVVEAGSYPVGSVVPPQAEL